MKWLYILFIFSFFISISFATNENDTIKSLQENYQELNLFKQQIDLRIKVASWIWAIIIFFWIKEFIDIKKSLKKAKEQVNEIENLRKIQVFRFLLEDYAKLSDREWNYTNKDFIRSKLKAKKVIYEFEKLQNFITINEFDPVYINAIADAYSEVDQYEKAKYFFEISYGEDPENPKTHYGIAYTCEYLYFDTKKEKYLQERYMHIKKAYELNPYEPIYICDFAFVCIQIWKNEDAYKFFLEAIKTDIQVTRNYIQNFKQNYESFFDSSIGKELLQNIKIS